MGLRPAGVTGLALDSSVQLAWQPVSGASGYTVYRGTSAASITTLLTPAGGVATTSYTDATAGNGTTYYYAVRSVTGGVESPNSLTAQVTPRLRACSSGNPVVLENCFPGASNWDVSNTATIAAGGIEGYATSTSINKGSSIDLKVNAAAGSSFRMEIYRMGYYGGTEARLISTVPSVPAISQPACVSDSSTGLLDCSNWSVSATISTTASWASGVYMVHLVRLDTGTDNQVMFVVRDDARASNLLYGVAFSNYQSYNNYGGKSLYTFNSNGNTTVSGTARAVKVSYDRPFEQPRSGLRDWFTRNESAMVSWLEQQGDDVSYISNTDLDQNGALALNHHAYMSPAHDEYYSSGMRTALENARAAGVNLFFGGSNAVYWHIRFENGPVRRCRPHPGLLQVDRERRSRSERHAHGHLAGSGRVEQARERPDRADVRRRQRQRVLPARGQRGGGQRPGLSLHTALEPAPGHLDVDRSEPRRLGVGRPRLERIRAGRRQDACDLAGHRQPDPGQRRLRDRRFHLDDGREVHRRERSAGVLHRHEPLGPRARAEAGRRRRAGSRDPADHDERARGHGRRPHHRAVEHHARQPGQPAAGADRRHCDLDRQ